eukprot:COSAG05_NODE_22346_length_265_cov_0.921687_1_plen_63_part_10
MAKNLLNPVPARRTLPPHFQTGSLPPAHCSLPSRQDALFRRGNALLLSLIGAGEACEVSVPAK